MHCAVAISEYNGLTPEDKRSRIGSDIYEAMKGIGFVYLLNHGIPDSLRQATVQSALDFFALPKDVKMKYHRFVRTGCNGYTPMKEEQLIHSEDASLDRVELHEAWDVMFLGEDMPEQEAPDFSRNIQEMMTVCDRVSLKVMAALEVAMGRPGLLTGQHLHQTGAGSMAVMRAFHYPPVPEHVPAGSVRCGTHSDWGSLTLLLQDEVGGLEVLSRAGLWVPAPPVPGAVLVMAGDMLEIWTGGRILATKHRVRLPEEERQKKAGRLSLAFFATPDDETTVAPPAESDGYSTVKTGEYLRAKFRISMPNAGLKL